MVVFRIFYLLMISGYNTLYKYLCVKDNISNFSNNSGFMGKYMTNSSYDISYFNIFICSLIIVFIIDFVFYMVMHFKEKKIKVMDSRVLLLFLLISFFLLFLNFYLSFFFISIGVIIYLVNIFKNSTPFYFIFSLVNVILTIIGLWFISY